MDRWRQNIHAAEVRLIALPPATLLGVILTALVAISILWFYLNQALILGWAGATIGLTLLRIVLWRHFHRIENDDAAVIAWDPLLTLTIGASGALWGAFGIGFYLLDDVEIRGVVLLILASMLAAGTIFYAAHLRAHRAYLLACALPIAIASFLHGKPASILFGCITFVYIVLISRAARSVNRSITGAIRRRIHMQSSGSISRATKYASRNSSTSSSACSACRRPPRASPSSTNGRRICRCTCTPTRNVCARS